MPGRRPAVLDSGGCMTRVLPESVQFSVAKNVQFSVAIDGAAAISGPVGTAVAAPAGRWGAP